MTAVGRAARTWLPVLVSVGILGWLVGRLGWRDVLATVDARAARILGAALLGYGAVSLALEAVSLVRAVGVPAFGLWTAARVKAASYLAHTLHYTVGIGALAVLIRNRAGLTLADAAGVALLITGLDVLLVLGLATLGALLLGTDTPAVRAGVIAAATLGGAGGLALLRTSRSLGPLERLRGHAVFRTARTLPAARLAEIGVLRLAFVLSFISVVGAALAAFDVVVPPAYLLVGVSLLVLVSALPIAVAGLGTGQVAFVYLFREYADAQTLLACSLAFSAGMIALRAGLGALFAREYAREAIAAVRQEEVA